MRLQIAIDIKHFFPLFVDDMIDFINIFGIVHKIFPGKEQIKIARTLKIIMSTIEASASIEEMLSKWEE